MSNNLHLRVHIEISSRLQHADGTPYKGKLSAAAQQHIKKIVLDELQKEMTTGKYCHFYRDHADGAIRTQISGSQAIDTQLTADNPLLTVED